eukprot:13906-Pelagococcus_subviridis.AAC.1
MAGRDDPDPAAAAAAARPASPATSPTPATTRPRRETYEGYGRRAVVVANEANRGGWRKKATERLAASGI